MDFIQETLIELQSLGYSQIQIERVLGLKIGELKDSHSSPEAISLFRILKTYPWMLEVAEAGYDSTTAKKQMVYNAGQTLSQMANTIK